MIHNLYDLAYEATVNEVIDSRAFSGFCGVALVVFATVIKI